MPHSVCNLQQMCICKLSPSAAAELPPPMPAPVPRRILFQRKRANRRIMNEDMFVSMLREFGEVRSYHLADMLHAAACCTCPSLHDPDAVSDRKCAQSGPFWQRTVTPSCMLSRVRCLKRHRCRRQVRVVEFNESTSFRQQLEAVSSTGLFVSVHTSNLANAQFMRPGAAVLEVIQRNWAHHDLDKSFQVRLRSSRLAARDHQTPARRGCCARTSSQRRLTSCSGLGCG